MGVYTNAVQKLYVAYFGRPADAAGLAYWEGVVTKAEGSTAAVSAAFAASDEYKAAYANLDAQHVVAQVYQNLFGHAPDLPGLNFWSQALINGLMTIDNVVTQIAAGAQGSDLTAYNNKVAAATAFTAALDTTAEVLAYSGNAANAAAKTFIAGVTDDASLQAAIAPAALNDAIGSIVDVANTGKTFVLTAAQDIIVGSTLNDTINVTTYNPTSGATGVSNLTSIDSIDGGAGKDTLNLDQTGGNNSLTGVTVKNVEIVNLTGAASADAAKFEGATNINLDATGTSVTNLGEATTVAFNGAGSNLTVGAAGASATVVLKGVAEAATLTIGGAALTAVNVSGTRVDGNGNGVDVQALNVTVGKDVQTLTLNTNQKSTLTVAQSGGSTKAFTTINASGSTAALTIDGSANTGLSTVTTSSGDDAVTIATATSNASGAVVNATVATGDGNDTIVSNATGSGMTSVDAGDGNNTVTVTTAGTATTSIGAGAGNDTVTISGTGTGKVSVSTGAGNDAITVAASVGAISVLAGAGDDSVVIQKVLATTDIINGGDGVDSIQFGGASARTADDYIVFNKLVTGFETISFSTAETGLDASKLAATYTGIELAAGSIVTGVSTQAITAHGDVTLTAKGYAAGTNAGTIGLTDSANGAVVVNADVLNLTVKAVAGNDVTATLSGDVRTANVTLTNAVGASNAERVAHLVLDNTNTDKALTSLTLTGSGDANVTNVGKLVNVDASGLNGAAASGGSTALAGLTYVSTNTAAETVKLGAAVDHITLSASTYGAMDTVTGLSLVAKNGALTAASDDITVSAINGAVAKFTTTQTDIDLALKEAAASSGNNLVFALGGDTYVYHDAGTVGQIDAADTVVKLTGTLDLDTLILALS